MSSIPSQSKSNIHTLHTCAPGDFRARARLGVSAEIGTGKYDQKIGGMVANGSVTRDCGGGPRGTPGLAAVCRRMKAGQDATRQWIRQNCR